MYRLTLERRQGEDGQDVEEWAVQEVGWATAKTVADAARSIADQLDPYPDPDGEPTVMIPLALLEKLLLAPRSEATDEMTMEFMKGIFGDKDKP